jgi:hypothetical protein
VEINKHIVQLYEKLYTEQFNWRPLLVGLSLDSFGEADVNWLEREFEESVVLEVVKAMNGDNAPALMATLWHSSKLVRMC